MSRVALELGAPQLRAQWKRCGVTADWLASYLACEMEPGARSTATNVLSTVINELLENAAKFCSDAEGKVRVAVRLERRVARVETWNRASDARARLLEVTLAELERGSADALFLQRTARPARTDAPGIGIIIVARDHGARVRATITYTEDGSADVHVKAEFELPGAD